MKNLQILKEEFINHLIKNGKSQHTIRSYEKNLKHYIMPYYMSTKMNIEDTNFQYLEDFKFSINKSSGTINNVIATLKSFFKFLYKADYIERDFGKMINGTKNKNIVLPDVLTKEQAIELLKSIDNDRDKVIFYLFLYCGLRLSELRNLKIEDINFDKNIINIINGKGGKNRKVGITKDLKALLVNYITQNNLKFHLIINNRTNNPLSNVHIYRIVKSYMEQFNMKGSPHTLRHTFATMLYGKTKDLLFVSSLLGHSSINTTRIYTHFYDTDISNSSEGLFE